MNPSSSVASGLQPHHCQELAINVLSKQEPISQIAKQEQVSRKFLTLAALSNLHQWQYLVSLTHRLGGVVHAPGYTWSSVSKGAIMEW